MATEEGLGRQNLGEERLRLGWGCKELRQESVKKAGGMNKAPVTQEPSREEPFLQNSREQKQSIGFHKAVEKSTVLSGLRV